MTMQWRGWGVIAVLACSGCGGGGGSTTDTGGETADVSEDLGDVPPDGGPDVDGDGDGDVEDVEAGADADADADAEVEDVPEDGEADLPEASKRSVLVVTSGGGTARGGSYGLTLTIGTPQPMGTGSSAGYHGSVGPGSVLGQ